MSLRNCVANQTTQGVSRPDGGSKSSQLATEKETEGILSGICGQRTGS